MSLGSMLYACIKTGILQIEIMILIVLILIIFFPYTLFM